MVALAMALQRYTVHSITPPGVLWRAVQELHRCLAPVIESGDQFDLEMLDVARRDPMAPNLCREGTITDTQGGGTNQCTCP